MKAARILLADDHDLLRHGVRALLETQKEWHIVGEATTGPQAVREAKRLRPDIVIMDIGLPELNGLLATRKISRALPHTEVLILSMHESEETIHRVLKSGARGYIVKTNAIQHLVSAVQSLLHHKSYFVPAVAQFLVDDYLREDQVRKAAAHPSLLTEREQEVLQLLVEGSRTKEIATQTGLSVRTIETHRNNIMRKLGLHSTVDLVRYAIRNHIVDSSDISQ